MVLLSKLFCTGPNALPRPQVPKGKTRICVAGFSMSHHTGRARAIAAGIAKAYPDKYETWFYFHTKGFKTQFLDSIKAEIKQSGGSLPEDHNTSPFVWLERQTASKKEMTGLGGRDKLCDWAKDNFDASDSNNVKFLSLCDEAPPHTLKEIIFDTRTPGTAKS